MTQCSRDDLLPHREAYDLGGVVEIELVHDVLAVRLDRVDADAEERRDLLVRLAFGDLAHHLQLALGEQVQVVLDLPAAVAEVVVTAEEPCGLRAEERMAARD